MMDFSRLENWTFMCRIPSVISWVKTRRCLEIKTWFRIQRVSLINFTARDLPLSNNHMDSRLAPPSISKISVLGNKPPKLVRSRRRYLPLVIFLNPFWYRSNRPKWFEIWRKNPHTVRNSAQIFLLFNTLKIRPFSSYADRIQAEKLRYQIR